MYPIYTLQHCFYECTRLNDHRHRASESDRLFIVIEAIEGHVIDAFFQICYLSGQSDAIAFNIIDLNIV